MSFGRRRVSGSFFAILLASTSVAGCSGGGGEVEEGSGEAKESGKNSSSSTRVENYVDTDTIVGELRGADDIVVRVHSAEREAGGFVTVSGTLVNEGDRPLIANRWRSEENSVKSKSSISGATLVDVEGKKRYLILRDTDGECLCTTGLTNIQPDEERPIYAQFPAPPSNVAQVEFQLPGMTPATVELSEG